MTFFFFDPSPLPLGLLSFEDGGRDVERRDQAATEDVAFFGDIFTSGEDSEV
jgi:hypothetical protein